MEQVALMGRKEAEPAALTPGGSDRKEKSRLSSPQIGGFYPDEYASPESRAKMSPNKSENLESPQIVIPPLALSKKQMHLTDKTIPNTTRA